MTKEWKEYREKVREINKLFKTLQYEDPQIICLLLGAVWAMDNWIINKEILDKLVSKIAIATVEEEVFIFDEETTILITNPAVHYIILNSFTEENAKKILNFIGSLFSQEQTSKQQEIIKAIEVRLDAANEIISNILQRKK